MTHRPRGARWLLALLSCVRFDDVVVLQGAPTLGAVMAVGRLTAPSVVAMLWLMLGNACLVAHVFLLNDRCGLAHDQRDPARSASVFVERGVARREVDGLLLVLLLLGLLVFAGLGRTTLAVGVSIALAGALYSIPQVHLKGIPLASSLLHLVSGVLHFLLGYSVFRVLDARGVELGLFFALIFSAGHLTQEVRDCEADARNGVETNAVRFGRHACFAVAFMLFTMADALLVTLALKGSVPPSLSLVMALTYPLQVSWSLQALRGGLTSAGVRRLQVRYRLLHALIGVAMVTAVLMRGTCG